MFTTGVDSFMTVNAWVLEAVEAGGPKGMKLRDVQRFIDERHYEELAVDTLEAALAELLASEQVTLEGDRYYPAKRTSKEDALRKLFGDV